MHLALSASYLGTDLGGRYRLERLVGEGASSWVFAGTDLRLEREVAVKLLKRRAEPEHEAQRLRFVQEGRMLARLAHPHVVAVHDAGETNEGDGYLVMELSRAGTLEGELSRRSLLALEETLRLVLPLFGALACAHDRGIVHRDLKPANIALVRHEGGETQAKLLDFGIARATGQGMSSGGLAGTPAYMAPEQARAEPCGPSADVWAMGVVLFRCLSGGLPFEASSSAAMLLKLIQHRAARIGGVCPGLPPRIAVALDRALEPDPTHRYPDMRTFARVLGAACRQDGVRIEANPEPIGLPQFGAWLERADVETTRRKSQAAEPSALGVMEPRVARAACADERDAAPAAQDSPDRRARQHLAFWALVLLVGLLAAMWSALGQPVLTRGQPIPARGQLVPARGQPMRVRGQSVPVRGQSVPAHGQPIPAHGQPIPAHGQPIPARDQAMPPRDQLMPPRDPPSPAPDARRSEPARQPECEAKPEQVVGVAPPPAEPLTESAAAPAPPRGEKGKARTGRRIAPAAEGASIPLPANSEASEPAPPGLITNWEW